MGVAVFLTLERTPVSAFLQQFAAYCRLVSKLSHAQTLAPQPGHETSCRQDSRNRSEALQCKHTRQTGIPAGVQQRLKVHDGFSDPLGWNGSTGTLLATSGAESYLERLGVASSEAAVVVDSLSSPLLHQSPAQVCRLLHQIGRHSSTLICLLHGDMHEDHVISQVCHVMSTNIQVQPVEPKLATDYHGKCSITHQKKSGKVIRKQAEWYSIARDLSITATEAAVVAPHNEHTGTEEHPDPTANLTFNLSLSAREREDRAKVVLPYTYSSHKKSEHLQVGAGKIFYQPDDADDFDESDPDDDLDI